jgi:hypothetical protein
VRPLLDVEITNEALRMHVELNATPAAEANAWFAPDTSTNAGPFGEQVGPAPAATGEAAGAGSGPAPASDDQRAAAFRIALFCAGAALVAACSSLFT